MRITSSLCTSRTGIRWSVNNDHLETGMVERLGDRRNVDVEAREGAEERSSSARRATSASSRMVKALRDMPARAATEPTDSACRLAPSSERSVSTFGVRDPELSLDAHVRNPGRSHAIALSQQTRPDRPQQ